MADQNRNKSNQRDQSQQGAHNRDDEIGSGQSRGRSTREPASSADDRGMGESQHLRDDSDELDRDTGIESDLDDMDDVDDLDESDRSNR